MAPNAPAVAIPPGCKTTNGKTTCPRHFHFVVGDSQEWIRTPDNKKTQNSYYLTRLAPTKTKLYCDASDWGWEWDGDKKAFDCT